MSPSNHRFISIEGTEGAGKSTAIRCLQSWFEERQVTPVITREPGGTPLAEEIRALLLAHRDESVAAKTELLLMYASRVQHTEGTIKPALEQGQWVISDRFNDASFAYQGTGRALGSDSLETLDTWALSGFKPGHTLFLDLPVDVGIQRAGHRGALDRIEKENLAFFERVRNGYLERAKADPERFIIIDASKSIAEVEQQIIAALDERLAHDF